ncbi:sensor histidine kinase [Haloactinopolyspora sp.]|uniref:sensor histidine kinase n=1 Tax=Haloactinopolyspora sp. TaxID=1966353 RepID=UPI0026385981|nr:sensor histidine kinase [Haloactinopolyspora sp.]
MGDVIGSRPQWMRGSAGDVLLAVVVGVVVIATTVVQWHPEVAWRSVPVWGWVLMLTGSAALALRRRFPVPVAVVALVTTSLYYPFMTADGALLLVLIVALYTLAAEGRLAVAVVISALAVIGSAYGEYGSGESPIGDAALFLLVGWLVAAVASGAVSHNRQAYLREELRRHATEERLRIARELHDALGHNISLINVQAGAALHRLNRDPEVAEGALSAIKESSREALQELRNTLGVLRQVDEEAPTLPPPSLNRLTELTRRSEAAGLTVDVHTSGDRGHLAPSVDVAAYRIVQEALTNVTRHAGASKVVVRVGYGRDDVTVEIEDDGRGGPAPAGNGIRGMVERARVVGGDLEVGERPGGGLRVSARLPREETR